MPFRFLSPRQESNLTGSVPRLARLFVSTLQARLNRASIPARRAILGTALATHFVRVLYYSALLEPILNKSPANRTLRVRGGSKLHLTLRFSANSNSSATPRRASAFRPRPIAFPFFFVWRGDSF
jgi:hypothetical protein